MTVRELSLQAQLIKSISIIEPRAITRHFYPVDQWMSIYYLIKNSLQVSLSVFEGKKKNSTLPDLDVHLNGCYFLIWCLYVIIDVLPVLVLFKSMVFFSDPR